MTTLALGVVLVVRGDTLQLLDSQAVAIDAKLVEMCLADGSVVNRMCNWGGGDGPPVASISTLPLAHATDVGRIGEAGIVSNRSSSSKL